MFRIYNKHRKGAINLPRALTIPQNGSITLPDEEWNMMARHAVVAAWLASGTLVAKQEADTTEPSGEALSAVAVLAMAEDGTPFPTFKAAATKLLGDATPSTKVEIVAALEAINKPVNNGWN